ncbi:hypothetical protein CEXT_334981 [Caerostris extrusa]|uniref:Uncharacterized protein n=1 Tax=Caerostris extrusa TaxID=172846 RepID=A0AAV4NAQ6_CAEEX|nr:hypothetical protein CEXT_334981 [Caerostris extrusa]
MVRGSLFLQPTIWIPCGNPCLLNPKGHCVTGNPRMLNIDVKSKFLAPKQTYLNGTVHKMATLALKEQYPHQEWCQIPTPICPPTLQVGL